MRGKKDVRVDVSLRNNLILRAMEERGIKNVAALCRHAGIPGMQAHVGLVVNMKLLPYTVPSSGGIRWRPWVEKIATALGLPPESLFSENQLEEPFEKNRIHLEEESEKVRAMLTAGEHYALPDALVEKKELLRALKAGLCKLRPQETKVLVLYFGLDGVEGRSFEDVGKLLTPPRTRTRVQQIEARAIKKLQMPHHAQPLKEAGALQHCG